MLNIHNSCKVNSKFTLLTSHKMKRSKNLGLSKKVTKNIYQPLNKYHVSTGLFVKDCNEQCTDDLFNNY